MGFSKIDIISVGRFSLATMIFAHLPLALVPPFYINRFFLAGGMTRSVSEWMWRRRNVAASEQKPRRVYSSRVAALLVCALLLLPYILLLCLFPHPARMPSAYTLDARATVLYVALQDAFSRSSSPYPFSINARRRRLSTTSRGTSLECWKEEKVGLNQRDSLRALRTLAGVASCIEGFPAFSVFRKWLACRIRYMQIATNC